VLAYKSRYRSLWKALGLTDEELTRPLIGGGQRRIGMRARHGDGRRAAQFARHRGIERAYAGRQPARAAAPARACLPPTL